MKPLSHELLFPNGGKVPDWRLVNTHISKEGRLYKDDFVSIIKDVTAQYKSEPNLLECEEPIVIVGDIHGQYYDLWHLLEKAGDPESTNYLFMGDYVDRGIFSVESMILLFSLKLNYPETFLMLRGNHECRNMTDHFTFKEEVYKKFDAEVYELIMDAFDSLPLCCLVGKKYFAMHGGISPDLKKVDQINKFDRCKEPPLDGLMCDLLWADPADDDSASKTEYIDNEEREWSFVFGKKPCK
jgi:serine/threonine-protein phosphatase 2B catalytic subunit